MDIRTVYNKLIELLQLLKFYYLLLQKYASAYFCNNYYASAYKISCFHCNSLLNNIFVRQDDLGRLLVQVCQTIPYGVLCFFSSYSMMTSQIERWQETDVWSELERKKLVLQEPRSNNELDSVMRDYRDAIHNNETQSRMRINGALLLAVFRGKVAEGIDFSDNEARCVISVSAVN